MAEDRAGPHDRDVEPGRDRVVTYELGPQLRSAVRLQRAARRVLGHGIPLGDAEHRTRRRVDDLGDARVARRDQHVRGSAHVDLVEQRPILGERDLGDVVEHHVDAVTRAAHRGRVPHVARDEVGPGECRAGRVHVEDAHRIAARQGLLREHRAEVAAASGHQERTCHQSWSPRARHQRTLTRMPSSNVTAGS